MLDKELLKEIIKLKEGEHAIVVSAYLKELGDKKGVLININEGLDDIFSKYVGNLIVLGQLMYNTFQKEADRDFKKSDTVELIHITVFPDGDKMGVMLNCNYLGRYMSEVRNNAYRKNLEHLLDELRKMSGILTNEFNEVLNKSIEETNI